MSKPNSKLKIAEARGLIWELQDTIDALRKLDPETPDEQLAKNLLHLSEQLSLHASAIHEEVTSRESKSKHVGLRPQSD